MVQHNILHIIIIIMMITHFVSSQSDDHDHDDDDIVAPALYVFGDSLVDNGNNNVLPTISKANYLPYSVKFAGQVPLGRFTDGKTAADFCAEYLGLPYPPPYVRIFGPDSTLSSDLFRETSIRGYNYASAACGLLPNTGIFLGKCISMDEQIEMFESTINSQLAPIFDDDGQLSQYLSKSIFLIIMGNNDYINYYFNPLDLSSKFYDSDQFAQLLVDTFSQQIKRLYDLGARKMVLSEIGPIGCAPFFAKTGRFFGNNGTCDENINRVVSKFNDRLATMLPNLSNSLIDSHFILVRVYQSSYDLIMNYAKYGFSDNRNPCCRSWMNGRVSCIPNIAPCSDSNKHIFWDGFHLTEAATRHFTTDCIYGHSTCFPFNVKHLVQL